MSTFNGVEPKQSIFNQTNMKKHIFNGITVWTSSFYAIQNGATTSHAYSYNVVMNGSFHSGWQYDGGDYWGFGGYSSGDGDGYASLWFDTNGHKTADFSLYDDTGGFIPYLSLVGIKSDGTSVNFYNNTFYDKTDSNGWYNISFDISAYTKVKVLMAGSWDNSVGGFGCGIGKIYVHSF